jgi:hypothetical protein
VRLFEARRMRGAIGTFGRARTLSCVLRWTSWALLCVGCGGPEKAVTSEFSGSAIGEPPAQPSAASTASVATAIGEGCLDDKNPPVIRLPASPRKRAQKDEQEGRIIPPGCEPSDASADCRYDWARYHLATLRPDLAAREFRDIALDPANGELGRFAASQALESLSMLATYAEPPRTTCIDNLDEDAKRYQQIHCATTPEPDEELCMRLRAIERDIARLAIEGMVKSADDGPPNDSLTLYREAGSGYTRLFDKHCNANLPRHRHAGVVCAELLYNAYRAYRAAHRPVEAEEARMKLLDPRNDLHKTALAKKVADEQ